MSDSKQPFTDYATKAGQPFKMSTYVAPGAAVLIVIVLSLCLWDQHQQHERDMDALRAKLKAATAAQAATQQDEAAFQQQVAALQGQIADLQKDKEQAEQAVQSAKGLEDEMRNSLESKDVTIFKLQGKLTVNILDRIMFDSGEADLKPGGEAVLAKVAAFLAQHPELKIHVIGHTDNVPIRGGPEPVSDQLGTFQRPGAGGGALSHRARGSGPAPGGGGGLRRIPAGGGQRHAGGPRAQPPHRHHHSAG